MKIREFTAADQADITRLQDAFMAEFFPEFTSDPRQYQWNADIYQIDASYLKNGGKFWVAEVNNDIVGFGGFRLLDTNCAEIKRLRIACAHRGKGLGTSIIRHIESYCRATKIKTITVDTDGRFEAAISMFTNLGYVFQRSASATKNNIVYTDNYYEKLL
ncbi:MAG TPA: GNAT family N-acetyltransferase [Gammaproteobacteria bacterium]|nr:GNAT family N-acetyltransferase [Gammaproteobacteria bacterium]